MYAIWPSLAFICSQPRLKLIPTFTNIESKSLVYQEAFGERYVTNYMLLKKEIEMKNPDSMKKLVYLCAKSSGYREWISIMLELKEK